MNVVNPPMTSCRMEELFSFKEKIFSIKFITKPIITFLFSLAKISDKIIKQK